MAFVLSSSDLHILQIALPQKLYSRKSVLNFTCGAPCRISMQNRPNLYGRSSEVKAVFWDTTCLDLSGLGFHTDLGYSKCKADPGAILCHSRRFWTQPSWWKSSHTRFWFNAHVYNLWALPRCLQKCPTRFWGGWDVCIGIFALIFYACLDGSTGNVFWEIWEHSLSYIWKRNISIQFWGSCL